MSDPVYIEPLPDRTTVVGAPTSITLFVGRTASGDFGLPTTVQSMGHFIARFGQASTELPMTLAVRDFYANGGGAAVVFRIGDPDAPAEPLSEADWLAGIASLPEPLNFNTFCLTPDVLGRDVPYSVVDTAAALCVDHRAMVILTPSAGWHTAWQNQTLPTALKNIYPDLPVSSRRSVAIYFPDLIVADPETDQPTAVSPAGAIAGVWATTDQTRGIWQAAAGTEAGLKGVLGLTARLTDEDNGVLNENGVCAIRQFPNFGDVVWGARTLAGAQAGMDEFAYIPVRRLALHIETSVESSLQWTVFEPNTHALWGAVTNSVGEFMTALWRQGAFVGATANEAFSVTCDGSTTTPQDIEQGILNVIIAFAPIRAAEFLILRIQASAAAPY